MVNVPYHVNSTTSSDMLVYSKPIKDIHQIKAAVCEPIEVVQNR